MRPIGWFVLATLLGLVPGVAAGQVRPQTVPAAGTCPASTMNLNGVLRSTTGAVDDTTISLYGTTLEGHIHLMRQQTLEAGATTPGGSPVSSDVVMQDGYELIGPVPGTPVPFTIDLPITGTASAYAGAPQGMPILAAAILLDGVTVDTLHPYGWCCRGVPVSTGKSVSATRPAGTVSVVGERVDAMGTSESASLVVSGWPTIGDLPPGVAVVTCHGDTMGRVLAVGPVPAGGLRIEDIWPNPAPGRFRVAPNIPRGAPAAVRLLDAGGRLVAARWLPASGASRREVEFGDTPRLAPGAYFVRVSQGVSADVRRIVLVR